MTQPFAQIQVMQVSISFRRQSIVTLFSYRLYIFYMHLWQDIELLTMQWVHSLQSTGINLKFS